MIICKYAIAVMWLILTVSACLVVTRQMMGFAHQSVKQNGMQKKPHSPNQIRPPPLLAIVFENLLQ